MFWERAHIASADECWRWKLYVGANGYGQVGRGGEVLFAHRVAYELAYGPLADGETVDHLCRVKSCVNPLHLEAVPLAENIRRAWRPDTSKCHNGHLLDEANTYTNPKNGWTSCRICARARQRAWKQRQKVAA